MVPIDDGLESRAAEPIDGQARSIKLAPNAEADVPGDVGSVRGVEGEGVADHDRINVAGVEVDGLKGCLAGVHLEVDRGEVLEGAAEGAEGGALGRDDVDGLLDLVADRHLDAMYRAGGAIKE